MPVSIIVIMIGRIDAEDTPSGGTATRQATGSDATRQALIDAAAEVFAERGYDGAGVAEIARRAGLTTGAIYSRYAGKAELLVDAMQSRMPAEIEELLMGGTGQESAVELLSALGEHLVEPLNKGEGLLLEAIVAARRSAELADVLRSRLTEQDNRLAKIVDEAKGAGLFDPELSTDAVVRLCQAIGLGMHLSQIIEAPMPAPDDWVGLIERLLAAAAPPPEL